MFNKKKTTLIHEFLKICSIQGLEKIENRNRNFFVLIFENRNWFFGKIENRNLFFVFSNDSKAWFYSTFILLYTRLESIRMRCTGTVQVQITDRHWK